MVISRKCIILLGVFLVLWYFTGYIFCGNELIIPPNNSDGITSMEFLPTHELGGNNTNDNINNAVDKETEYISSNNSSKVSLTTEERIILINQKYCGQKKCKFLYVYFHSEQETKANLHFRSFTQLSEALNRTMVLTNVGNSRIGACQANSFDFYYNVEKLKEEFPNLRFIEQSKFLNWVEERNLVDISPDAEKIPLQFTIDHYQMQLEPRKVNSELYTEVNPDYELFTRKGCFDKVKGLDLTDPQTHNKIKFQSLDISQEDSDTIKGREGLSKFIVKSFASDSDVILIKHRIWKPLFPKVMPIITYADHINEEADRIRKKLHNNYIAIHWRMERVVPDLLPQCAGDLIETLISLMNKTEIKHVYLATDYPISGRSQSVTFRKITSYHDKAMEILKDGISFDTWVSLDSLKKLQKGKMHKGKLKDPGVKGILDKLICVNSSYFISGPVGCSRIASSYTQAITQMRKYLKKKGGSLQNVILRWKRPKRRRPKRPKTYN